MDFSAGGITAAGDTTHPICSIYAAATRALFLTEAAIWNTSAAAVSLKLVRITTAGTPGTGATEASWDNVATAVATVFGTHTGTAPTLGADLGIRMYLPAGSGAVRTFGGHGIEVPAVANAGVGWIVESGTGQICLYDFSWTE